jgi:outer membrane protein insertion porin family
VREKNVRFNLEVDKESLRGNIDVTDPNYDLLGNSLTYSIFSNSNDKPDQGYENTLVGASIGTAFEQYKNLFASLDITASFDDLTTDSTATASLKKQAGEFAEISGGYGFAYDKRNRSFMPTDGSIVSFNQTLPLYADKPSLSNSFSASAYKTVTENVIGAGKFFLTAVHGLNDEDVRISKRKNLSTKRLRGFEKGKVGPKDGGDHVGGNYAAALNFEANLPNLLPESTKTDIGLFLDFANVWGVDYDSSVDDSNTLRSSTGVAASWISPLGPMTFVLSTNLQKASSDKTESFNFNLGTTF